jgi:integrase
MPKTFQFTEAKIRATPAPATGREYHKDTRFPGLQLCITSAGTATYYLVKRIGGKPTRVRLGTVEQLSVEQARTIAAKIAGEVASGRDPQAERQKRRAAPTLDNVWFQWLEVHAKPHKRTWKEDERMYGRCLKVFHARRIATIRPAEVAAWHTQLGETNGHYLANRAKALLSTLCNYAIRLEMIVVSPCRSVPSFPEQSRERFLLPSEMKAFFDALVVVGEPWCDLFQVALFTGGRYGTVASMRWEEIDLDRMVWTIPASKVKNKRPVTIALSPPAVAILRTRLELSNGCPYVFPSSSPSGHVTDPWRAWDKVRAVSGLKDLRVHDLRRSLGSWQAVAGASLAVIGASLGHADLRSTQVYARLTMEPIRESISKAADAMMQAAGVKLLEGHSTPHTEGNDDEENG